MLPSPRRECNRASSAAHQAAVRVQPVAVAAGLRRRWQRRVQGRLHHSGSLNSLISGGVSTTSCWRLPTTPGISRPSPTRRLSTPQRANVRHPVAGRGDVRVRGKRTTDARRATLTPALTLPASRAPAMAQYTRQPEDVALPPLFSRFSVLFGGASRPADAGGIARPRGATICAMRRLMIFDASGRGILSLAAGRGLCVFGAPSLAHIWISTT